MEKIMKYFVYYFAVLIFTINCFNSFSQIKISGRVLEEGTDNAIENVIVYTTDVHNFTLTNENGYFSLTVPNQSEPIYFLQLAYNLYQTQADSLLINPDVYLTQNDVILPEIIVEPVRAHELLKKAFKNLIERYDKKMQAYLTHVEGKSSIGGKRELYALIEAKRIRTSIKKKLIFDFDLVYLDEKENINEFNFYINGNPIKTEFFPQRFSMSSGEKDCLYEIFENNDDKIVIKIIPKQLNKRRYKYALYTINKSDTVLTEYISQSMDNVFDLTHHKFKGGENKILNHYSKIAFYQDKESGLFSIESVQNTWKQRITLVNSSYDIINSASCFFINSYKDDVSINKKEINQWDNVLFEIDFPETSDFWKQYVK
jgi:hypothetical protein